MPSQDVETRDREIVRLKLAGYSITEIASHFGLSPDTVSGIYWSAISAVPIQSVTNYRMESLERLDRMRRQLNEIAAGKYVTVSQGQVVRAVNPATGVNEPVPDIAPNIAALEKLLAVETRQAKLLGLDAPARVEMDVQSILYEIVGVPTEALTTPGDYALDDDADPSG